MKNGDFPGMCRFTWQSDGLLIDSQSHQRRPRWPAAPHAAKIKSSSGLSKWKIIWLVYLCIYIYICTCMYVMLIWSSSNLYKSMKYNWLLVYQPLWKIWVRQLGWWHSQYYGKIKVMFQSPPTSHVKRQRNTENVLSCFLVKHILSCGIPSAESGKKQSFSGWVSIKLRDSSHFRKCCQNFWLITVNRIGS